MKKNLKRIGHPMDEETRKMNEPLPRDRGARGKKSKLLSRVKPKKSKKSY